MQTESMVLDLGVADLKFATGDPDGTFEGMGAVFSNVDSHGDVIQRGAFANTLKEWERRGKLPPMLLQHGGFLGGALDEIPIGKWTEMQENARGLKVRGELFALGTERGQYIHAGLKAGALDGLSIGFRTKRARQGTKPGEPRRTLEELDLVEVSVVTFPANPRARVGNVKATDIRTIRQFEGLLRDVGFSHAAAKAIAADGFKALSEPRDEDVAAYLAKRMDALAKTIQS